MKYIFLLLSLTVLFYSCETDFETNAEWEDITVVYGLLDQRDSVQYIKVNKAFLGDGDALMFAKIPDSINYDSLIVRIEEWNEDGNYVQTIVFDKTEFDKPNEPDAIFDTTSQIIFKGVIPQYYEIRSIVVGNQITYDTLWLNDKSTYKLFIQIPDGSKLITAETYLVQSFAITKPFPGSTSIKFVPNPVNTTLFSWEKADNDNENNFRYELKVLFNYKELTLSGDTLYKFLTLASGAVYPQGGSNELVYYYKDNNFFISCTNNIPYDDPSAEGNILERYTGKVEIKVTSAAAELNLFMQVYEPSTSIVQEKPPYTNIDNGIGIFSARYFVQENKKLHDETIADLKEMYFLKFVR